MTAQAHKPRRMHQINTENKKRTQLSGSEIYYNRTLGGIFFTACRTAKSPRISSVPPSIVSNAEVRRY